MTGAALLPHLSEVQKFMEKLYVYYATPTTASVISGMTVSRATVRTIANVHIPQLSRNSPFLAKEILNSMSLFGCPTYQGLEDL